MVYGSLEAYINDYITMILLVWILFDIAILFSLIKKYFVDKSRGISNRFKLICRLKFIFLVVLFILVIFLEDSDFVIFLIPAAVLDFLIFFTTFIFFRENNIDTVNINEQKTTNRILNMKFLWGFIIFLIFAVVIFFLFMVFMILSVPMY